MKKGLDILLVLAVLAMGICLFIGFAENADNLSFLMMMDQ